MRGRKKFAAVWSVLIVLALIASAQKHIVGAGYESIDAFASDALVWAIRAGFILIPSSAIYYYKFGRYRRQRSGRLGRTSKCYQCRQPIQEFTGSNCKFCGWIRCSCGACGCSFGKMS